MCPFCDSKESFERALTIKESGPNYTGYWLHEQRRGGSITGVGQETCLLSQWPFSDGDEYFDELLEDVSRLGRIVHEKKINVDCYRTAIFLRTPIEKVLRSMIEAFVPKELRRS